MKRFSPGVSRRLDHYVYRLIDPKDKQGTFYVGKGQGNRVFAHANGELKLKRGETHESTKQDTIRRILEEGGEVGHVVHRHGMNEKTALEVEAALIDAYSYLTNQVSGHGVEHGAKKVEEIEAMYASKPMKIDPKHRLLLIKTKWETVDDPEHGSVYEAVRRSWILSRDRARRADYVLAVIDGVCVGVFKATEWVASPPDLNGEKKPPGKPRSEFVGKEVSGAVADQYVNRVVPPSVWRPGAANPIRYVGPW